MELVPALMGDPFAGYWIRKFPGKADRQLHAKSANNEDTCMHKHRSRRLLSQNRWPATNTPVGEAVLA
jgi:hypothetical protein